MIDALRSKLRRSKQKRMIKQAMVTSGIPTPAVEAMAKGDLTRAELGRVGVWVDSDGVQMHVSQMSTKHLQNVAKMLEKHSYRIKERMIAQVLFGVASGDKDIIEVHLLRQTDALDILRDSVPMYGHIKRELERRGK